MMKKAIASILISVLALSAVYMSSCGKTKENKPHWTTKTITGESADKTASDTALPEDGLTWTVDKEGTLLISGRGDMADYTLEAYNQSPWHSEKDNIKKVIIEDGVTSIGEWAFEFCSSLESVTIPGSVALISDGAFYNCASLRSITIPDSVIAIGEWVFKGCSDLTIYCSSGSCVNKYASYDGITVIEK